MLLTSQAAPTQHNLHFSTSVLQRTYNRVANAQASLDLNDPQREALIGRLGRGWLLFFSGQVLDAGVFGEYYVQGSKGAVYATSRARCECEDAARRGVECKHIVAVRCLEYARAAQRQEQAAKLEGARLATLAKNRRLTLVRQEKTASA